MPPQFCQWLVFLGTLLAGIISMNGQTPAAPKLASTAFDFTQLQPKPTPVGEYRGVVDRPTATLERLECHITTLKSGERSHPPHHHPQEEFIVLKEGTLDASINGQITRIGPGGVLFFASNDVHNVTNVGGGPATYLVFNLTTAHTHHVPAQPAAESAAPTALKSMATDWNRLPVKKTSKGERREIANSPTVTCTNFEAHVTTIGPGEIPHPSHHHPDEEIIVVKDGLMEATFGGVAHRGGPGSIFFYASNDEHGMKNIGATPATYYVIRIVTDATPKLPRA